MVSRISREDSTQYITKKGDKRKIEENKRKRTFVRKSKITYEKKTYKLENETESWVLKHLHKTVGTLKKNLRVQNLKLGIKGEVLGGKCSNGKITSSTILVLWD